MVLHGLAALRPLTGAANTRGAHELVDTPDESGEITPPDLIPLNREPRFFFGGRPDACKVELATSNDIQEWVSFRHWQTHSARASHA